MRQETRLGDSINVEELTMRRTIEQEEAALKADEARISERREKLDVRRKGAAERALKASGLFGLESQRLSALAERMKALGMDEVERRLS